MPLETLDKSLVSPPGPRPPLRRGAVLLAWSLVLLRSVSAAETAPPAPGPTPIPIPVLQKKVDFEASILPIFKRNCLACHNQTDAEGDLVLETPATIAKGGEDGPVVVPRQSGASLLLKTCTREKKPFMPPKNNKVGAEVLKPEELALVKAWIDQGATGVVKARAKPLEWKPLPPGLHPILAVTVSTDGQFAACGRANQIFIYHVPTGQMVARLIDPKLSEPSGRSGYRSAAQRDFVQCLSFSPDGRMLASGEYRMVKLWQHEPNLPQFTVDSGTDTAVAASLDGKWLATAGKDQVIRIWDASNGQKTKELAGHTGPVRALRFSPDHLRLASGSDDHSLRIWELATGKIVAQADTAGAVTAVAWIPGSKWIAAAGGDNLIRYWQMPAAAPAPAPTASAPPPPAPGAAPAEPVPAPPAPPAIPALTSAKELTGHSQPVTCLECSTDGKRLVSGSADGTIRVWATDSAKQALQRDHGTPVTGVAISPDGKTIASAGGNAAKLWETATGKALPELKGDHRARAAVGEKERAVALAKSEGVNSRADVDTLTKAQSARSDAVKKAGATLAAAQKTLADQKVVLEKATDDKTKAAADESVKKAEKAVKTATTGVEAAETAAKQAGQALAEAKAAVEHASEAEKRAAAEITEAKATAAASEKPIRAVTFLSNQTVATGGDDQAIRTWSVETGAGFDTYPGQIGPIQILLSLPDGRLVSAAADKGAVVWRTVPTWTLARTIGTGDEKSPLINRVLALDFSPDNQLLVTGGGAPSRNGELKLWRVSDGSLVREFKNAHSDTVFGASFSPDGKTLATASADKFVKLFDVASGKLLKTLSGHTHYALAVSWRADGRGLASGGGDKVVKLWSFPAGEQLKTIPGFNKEVTSVRFYGPAGEMLTSSGDTKVRLLKEDGSALKDLAGGKGYIFSTAITPDGRVILGGGQDSTLRIWDAATGKALFTLEAPPAEATGKAAAVRASK